MPNFAREGLILLVMDVQNDFCSPEGRYGTGGSGFDHVPAAAGDVITRIAHIIPEFKSVNVPVVATKLLVLSDRTGRAIGVEQFRPALRALFETEGFRRDTWGQQLVDELLTPECRPDYEVNKWGHSAMYLTELEKVLRSLKARTVVLAGLGTNGVVEGTARDIVSRGWDIITLRDCVVAPHKELHEASLLNLSHLGQVVDSAEFLARLG